MPNRSPRAAAEGDNPSSRALERLERLAWHWDRAFGIPGTKYRIGWDGIIGLVPGIGDTLALAPAAYIVWSARRMGVPTHVLIRMLGNTGADWVIGLVPLLGDVLDFGFKSNSRNVALLRKHLEKQTPV
ncbi:DUF4112 domain-containing protein [Rhodobacteraceae bacterium]|nr:DUF4112 domain-containing protein [Paracoccaceae bacterium]